jgi:hypothetical protein
MVSDKKNSLVVVILIMTSPQRGSPTKKIPEKLQFSSRRTGTSPKGPFGTECGSYFNHDKPSKSVADRKAFGLFKL